MSNTSVSFVAKVTSAIFRNSIMTAYRGRYSSVIDSAIERGASSEFNLDIIKAITVDKTPDAVYKYPSSLYSAYKLEEFYPNEGNFESIDLSDLNVELPITLWLKDTLSEIIVERGYKSLPDDIKNFVNIVVHAPIDETDIRSINTGLEHVMSVLMMHVYRDIKTVRLLLNDIDKETRISLLNLMVTDDVSYPGSLINKIIRYYNKGKFPFYRKRCLVRDLVNGKFDPVKSSNLWTLIVLRVLAVCEVMVSSKLVEESKGLEGK